VSALLGLFVIVVAALMGTAVGLISGYFGGTTDLIVTRIIDASLTIPTVFAALLLVVVLGPGFSTLTVSLVIFLWARFARVLRGEALRFREKGFVKRAIVVGGGVRRVLIMHVAPNLLDTILVLATINFGYVIVAEASLSFLGLGLPPPTATWGQMVSEGRNYLRDAWWLSMMPGFAIMLVVLAFSRMGDWIRDRLDPYSEQKLS
jgi:peptide/nickel transport system permease protein